MAEGHDGSPDDESLGRPAPLSEARRDYVEGIGRRLEGVREALTEWLTSIGMIQAGAQAAVDTLIGYWEPYATSHDKLDAQPETFVQVANAAQSLARLVRDIRSGAWHAPDAGLRNPRQK